MKRVGILGLPGSGKTTVFQILVQGAGNPVPAARDQVGVVRVPDERIDRLAALYRPKKTTYTQIQFVDSAVSHPAGRAPRGPDLFASVRTCDALALVVRDFANPAVPITGGVDPRRDLAEIETELVLNDLAIVEARLERIEKELRVGKKQGAAEREVLAAAHRVLESARPLRGESFEGEAEKMLRGFQLLSRKPLLVVVNRDDGPSSTPPEPSLGSLVLALRAELEREVVALPPEDRAAFRAGLAIGEDGLSLVIRACYQLLGLISFFTVGPDEVRAWTTFQGARAVEAAGEIHSDMARGFIRAEAIGWRELLESGGTAGARTRGLLRLEGREYRVQDGDCLEIRFNK